MVNRLNDLPLVSIAIITYNQKNFLRECIESCLNQDYKNIEIVVADDASTDGTQDMLNEYSASYPGVFVLRLSAVNQGITKNSNLAHFACTGKYVAWIGGDDLMLPTKVSKQVQYMESNPECSICYHDLDVFFSETNATIYIQSTKFKPREGDVRTLIKYGCINGACSTMVRADCMPKFGFHEFLPVASDWCYWVDVLANGGSIRYIPEVLARYRRHSGNVTNKNSTSIGQNELDHLNTSNYIAVRYPLYFDQAMYSHAINLRSHRRRLPYFSTLLHVIKNTLDLKSIVVLLIFLLTFGSMKI